MRRLAAAFAITVAALTGVAAARSAPPYAAPIGRTSIRGVVVAFDGAYALRIADQRGRLDDVRLHDGTIIVPQGRRLAAGMPVIVRGAPLGAHFEAVAIQTFVDPTATVAAPFFDDGTESWQGYNRYTCPNAPAPPIHAVPATNASWPYGQRC